MTIQDVVTAAQAAIKTGVTKIQSAPAYPSDARVAVPTSIAFADNIRFIQNDASFKQTLFDLKIDIVIPRGDLESAMYWLAGVPKSVADIFRADPTIGGKAQTYGGAGKPITANFVSTAIDGMDYIGYRVLVPDIKLNE